MGSNKIDSIFRINEEDRFFRNSGIVQTSQHPKVRYKRTEGQQFIYTFENFFHPFIGELIEKLNKESLTGLLDADFHKELADKLGKFFEESYQPKASNDVRFTEFPVKQIDVTTNGPYSNYNWELFFHIPLTIAVHLSKNQRFAEAQRWFHYIFDPTDNRKRYWKFIAFREPGCMMQVDQLLALLSKPETECDERELKWKKEIGSGYAAIMDNPFKPHTVARTRQISYQYHVVMKYLDNLIAWGDNLFQQDTVESINEATMRYVLAANILGTRPQKIPQHRNVKPKTFAELRNDGLDSTGNTLVELQGNVTLNFGLPRSPKNQSDMTGPLFGIGRSLYFCIPRNDKMLGYWDTVADRLFKIRHCMNIEGVVRQLALFDPPLDPGMLVKATAAGIDIGSVVSGLNQPVSPVRCLFMIQKALELCAEVRSLGSALLSAIEKKEAEHLTLLRQSHEINIQKMQQEIRFLQWKQAQETTKSLLTSRKTALERFHYYQRLLGLSADPNVPDQLPLDSGALELTEENFDNAFNALVGQYDKPIRSLVFPSLKISDASKDGLRLLINEEKEFEHLQRSRDFNYESSLLYALAASFVSIPDTKANLHFWGLGGTLDAKIGTALSSISRFSGSILGIISAWEREQAGMVSKVASYERRADEWLLQHNLAAHELMQIGRQILTSLISEQITRHEYMTIKKQIENSQEIDRFLHDKFANEQLYNWMQGEISRLYYEYYRFAFDTARKAEQTMKRELMRPEIDTTDYVKFNYWDGGHKGLLSGETLYLDVKRMEMAYHEHNKREFELAKHVSLRQLDPVALLTLKATGSCQVTIPEWVYDLDCPGHYMRRIKNVALSIPCVTGPYTSINCTLSLLKSSLRKSSIVGEDYMRQGSEDSRFVDYIGTVQSIVTSNAQSDSGLFETNLRDERFLPFEGAGAESTWKLELPTEFRQFDYNTISDVILHIRYTARQGGGLLAKEASAHLLDLIKDANSSGFALLLNVKHDFPSEWQQYLGSGSNFTAIIKKDHFPYLVSNQPIKIEEIKLYAFDDGKVHSVTPKNIDLIKYSEDMKKKGEFNLSLSSDGTSLSPDNQANIFVIIKYSVSSA